MPTHIETPRRTELQDLSSLLVQIMGAKYLCDMPDAAMDNLRDAGNTVVETIVQTKDECPEDRQAKLDAITTLSMYNAEGCYTRSIVEISGSLRPQLMMAAE